MGNVTGFFGAINGVANTSKGIHWLGSATTDPVTGGNISPCWSARQTREKPLNSPVRKESDSDATKQSRMGEAWKARGTQFGREVVTGPPDGREL